MLFLFLSLFFFSSVFVVVGGVCVFFLGGERVSTSARASASQPVLFPSRVRLAHTVTATSAATSLLAIVEIQIKRYFCTATATAAALSRSHARAEREEAYCSTYYMPLGTFSSSSSESISPA